MGAIETGLYGRRNIYASDDVITADNIIETVNEALVVHVANLLQEEDLYWRRRGITPILMRKKEIRPEINNKISESSGLINTICEFKDGYFLTQPAYYIARKDGAQDKVAELNEYLYVCGKQNADNVVTDWFHTVGKGAIWVKANDDRRKPASVYALDPRSAFVVYSLTPGNKPVMGVNMVVVGDRLKVDAITENYVFRLSGGVTGRLITGQPTYVATVVNLDGVEPNTLGKIPIIEYSANMNNLAAAEPAMSLLDALDQAQSDRLDAVDQFIQSLVVTWNCKFEEGLTANDIRQYGMVNLQSTGDNRQDLKILSEQLDQSQTQVLINDLYERILTICSVPTPTNGGMTSGLTGAAILARDGWYQADAVCRNTEDMFKKSNRLFDEIFLEILARKNLLTDIELTDFELMFVRNETSNIQAKAQAFSTLMTGGLEPSLALAKSGVSNDPVADYKASEKWMKLRWGDPDAPEESTGPQMGQNPGNSANPGHEGDSHRREGWVEGYYRD